LGDGLVARYRNGGNRGHDETMEYEWEGENWMKGFRKRNEKTQTDERIRRVKQMRNWGLDE